MKVYSVERTHEGTATFYGQKGEARTASTELRRQKVHHVVRCHEVKVGGAEDLARVLNDAAERPWSVVTVVSAYDGRRVPAPVVADGASCGCECRA